MSPAFISGSRRNFLALSYSSFGTKSHILPQFPITKLEGTYLAWVDCSAVLAKRADGATLSHCGLDAPHLSLEEYLLKHQQVLVNDGSMYGDNRFIRINLACPRQRLEEGLKRIVKGLHDLI